MDGGAVDAVLKARDDGVARWAGITGHGRGTPAAQAEAVRRYDLDTVMFPINPRLWSDPGYRTDAEALLALCEERDVGVMAIKAVAARPWEENDSDRWARTWYEPYRTTDDCARGIRFVLSFPTVAGFCTPGDPDMLPTMLDQAAGAVPMDADERDTAIIDTAREPALFP